MQILMHHKFHFYLLINIELFLNKKITVYLLY